MECVIGIRLVRGIDRRVEEAASPPPCPRLTLGNCMEGAMTKLERRIEAERKIARFKMMRAWTQHNANVLHVYCRLVDFGVPKSWARWVCTSAEVVLKVVYV